MGTGEFRFCFRAVAITVLRGAGKNASILLLRRAKGQQAGLWCQVTGRIEREETAWQAAVREVAEETGLHVAKLYSADYCDIFYIPSTDTIEAIPIFVATVADNVEVRLNTENTEYRWVDVIQASEMVPFVGHRLALREIRRDFIDSEVLPWKLIKDFGSPGV
jgi:dATP pyrophosphohydrolase